MRFSVLKDAITGTYTVNRLIHHVGARTNKPAPMDLWIGTATATVPPHGPGTNAMFVIGQPSSAMAEHSIQKAAAANALITCVCMTEWSLKAVAATVHHLGPVSVVASVR